MMKHISLSLLMLVAASCMYAADPASNAEKERMAQVIAKSRKENATKVMTKQEEWEHLNQIFEKNRIRETEEEHRARLLRENPMMAKNEEVKKALMRAEVDRYSQPEMQDRIKRERELFDEQEIRRRTEEMRYFDITIERTFREDAQDDLARLVIDGVKEYERTCEWGWSVNSDWREHEDGTRSLECSVRVDPKEIMTLYYEANPLAFAFHIASQGIVSFFS